jgi:hypothetical protein
VTLRVRVGPHVSEASDGTLLHLDQPMSRQQCDVLLAAIAAAGQTVDSTVAVEIDEAHCAVGWLYVGRGEITEHWTSHWFGTGEWDD